MNGVKALLASPQFQEVASGRRLGLLILDYDGTLAPFRAKRDEASPYPGVIEALRRIPVTGPGRFVILSGRQWTDIPPLLGLDRSPEIWGCHGGQRHCPGGHVVIREIPAWQAKGLQAAHALALAHMPGENVEAKPLTLALHWRGLGKTSRKRIETAMGPAFVDMARKFNFEILEFSGGLELRPAGMNKALAIHALQAENPQTAIFFLGDDLTDEDAFFILARLGTGILVRRRKRPSSASFWLRPPEELLFFLNCWASMCLQSPRQTRGDAQ